ncbi:HNH endonuclease family protein [Mycobacterium timonense]|uniref:GmrSD restriction endonucleases C-terminal domain-containing protein n=1 Tax=Mycobacterium timonense TaxID=701043 RepID=A0ABX3TEB2_9MYCO|nr:HNH endonuclease family protein [Mycobacterium timonense]ORB77115.1 hypothetical protein BST46_26345 [Mycobacterium timonense]
MKLRHISLAAAVASAAGGGWTTLGGGEHQARSTDHPAPAASGSGVRELLAKVTIVEELTQVPGYERGCGIDKTTKHKEACVFGPAWNDPTDHSGCDTRSRVLRAQLQDAAFKPGTNGCKPVSGWLIDPYTGQRITVQQTNIDHIYPLARAWSAGAWNWDLRQRQIFANDPSNLVAVSAAANKQKGDLGLDHWLPSNQGDRCNYVRQYLSTAVKYRLEITVGDRAAALNACTGGGT